MIPRMTKNWLAALAFLVLHTSVALAQYANPNTPIVFNNGAVIDTGTLYPSTTLTSYPLLSNPVQFTGGTGTLISVTNKSIGFLSPFTGTGTLVVFYPTPTTFVVVGAQGPYPVPQTITSGLTLRTGEAIFGYGATTISGGFTMQGNGSLGGNVTFTSNMVGGTGTLSLGVGVGGIVTFSGAGSGFFLPASIDPQATPAPGYGIMLTNTSGTQTFAGVIGDDVARTGLGGTTNIMGQLNSNVTVAGGTLVLTNGGTIGNTQNGNTAVVLQGGTLVMDDTAGNFNRFNAKTINFNGGNLTLLGLNGGATSQQLTLPDPYNTNLSGPTFALGLNIIQVTAGASAGSAASLIFTGSPLNTQNAVNMGSVDFEGLGTNSHVIFTAQAPGPIAPWATFNGTDFAGYDPAQGVIQLSATGRPPQIVSATSTSYVLATSPQTPLSADAQAAGVTMNVPVPVDLGGHTLKVGGWIQNVTGSITDGTLGASSAATDLCITTNADLTVQTPLALNMPGILKNGAGTLNLTGPIEQGVFGTNSFPVFYVNSGTMTLNVLTPLFDDSASLPTITIGASSGAAAHATLSITGPNPFYAGPNTNEQVTMLIQQGGQFLTNGFPTTVRSVEIDGGSINQGGGTFTTGSITANPLAAAGQISGGALVLTGSTPTISVTPPSPGYAYQASADGLVISSSVNSQSPLTKTGNGVLVLGAATNNIGSTGTVALIISQGSVAVKNNGAIGTPGQQIQITNYGAIEAETSGTLVLPNSLSIGPASFFGSPIVVAGPVSQTSHGPIGVANTTTLFNYSNSLAANPTAPADGKTGPGTLILSGNASGSSTGTFTVSDGILAFAANQPLPGGMTIGFAGGALEAVNSPCVVINPLNISADVNFVGSQPLTFAANFGNVLGNMVTRAIYTNGTQPVTIANLTAQSSTLVSAGPGTLVLEGNPFGFVATLITGGTLELENAPAAGALLGQVTVSAAATWNLNNSNATASALAGTGTVSLGTGTLTASSGSFTGTINGAGALLKNGISTLTLSGTLSYTGATSVTGGLLILTSGLTSTASVATSSGATLTLAGGTLSAAGNIVNTGTMVLGGGTSVAAGGTFTNNGTLDLRNDPSYVLPANFVNNGTVLTAPPATDTPTMPQWALILTTALLGLVAMRQLAPVTARRN